MQHTIGIDVLVNKIGSAYKLVNLTARRAIEIAEGSPKLVKSPLDQKTINTALQEIAEGKITYTVKE